MNNYYSRFMMNNDKNRLFVLHTSILRLLNVSCITDSVDLQFKIVSKCLFEGFIVSWNYRSNDATTTEWVRSYSTLNAPIQYENESWHEYPQIVCFSLPFLMTNFNELVNESQFVRVFTKFISTTLFLFKVLQFFISCREVWLKFAFKSSFSMIMIFMISYKIVIFYKI